MYVIKMTISYTDSLPAVIFSARVNTYVIVLSAFDDDYRQAQAVNTVSRRSTRPTGQL